MNYDHGVATALHRFKLARTRTEWPGYEFIIQSVAGMARVLDFGCGTGWVGELVAKAGSLVDGVDRSLPMVQKAQSLVTDPRIFQSTDFLFSDEEYDAAIACFVFCEYGDLHDMISDMRLICKALKPGGKLYILHANWDKSNGREFTSSILHKAELYSGAPIHVTLKSDPLVEIDDYYWPQEEYRRILLEAGFSETNLVEFVEGDVPSVYVMTATR